MSRPPQPARGGAPGDVSARLDRLSAEVSRDRRIGAGAAALLLVAVVAVAVAALRPAADEAARASAETALQRAEAALALAQTAREAADAAASGVEAGQADTQAAAARLDAIEQQSAAMASDAADREAALGALREDVSTQRDAAEARDADARAAAEALAQDLAALREDAEARDAETRERLAALAETVGPAALPTTLAGGSFSIGERGLDPRQLTDGRAYVIGFERFPARFDADAFSDADPTVVVSVSAEIEEAGELEVASFTAKVLYAEPDGFAWFASAPDPEALTAARLAYVAVAQ